MRDESTVAIAMDAAVATVDSNRAVGLGDQSIRMDDTTRYIEVSFKKRTPSSCVIAPLFRSRIANYLELDIYKR